MSHIVKLPLSNGYVSTGTDARDPSDLDAGELVTMKAAYYRKNDPKQVWPMPGRSTFGSAGSGGVKGIAICQFDEGGTDKLLASISTKIVASTPGSTGTFTDLITGLNASATRLTACHQDDRWYLGNGYDKNKCLKPDGTTRDMGMATPQQSLVATVSTSAGAAASPTAHSGGFSNPLYAYDGLDTTYAGGTLTDLGELSSTWTTWAANTNASRYLNVRWSLAGLPIDSDIDRGSIGTGGGIDSGYNVTVTLLKSEDGGSNFTAFYTTTTTRVAASVSTLVSVAANSNLVQFKATLTYNSGTSQATLRIYEVKIQYGSTTVAFDTTGTMYYTYTEYDSLDLNESPPVDFTEVAAFTSKNMVQLDRSATVNAAATHWNVYRSVPGAAKTIGSMGLVKQVSITETTFYDTFDVPATTQLTSLIPAMTIGDLSIPRDTQPPAFISMISWKGSIVGISRTNRRTLRYSESGRPESFPEFYVVSSFPIDEHDGLVGQMAVGETLVLLMEGAVLALDDLPRVVDGQFNGADARPLKGHPGCVGNYAYTTFSVAGEPRGAWVSPFGVYITNGQTCAPISEDLAWENEVNVSFLTNAVLRWDAKNLILWFEFDSDGDGLNDREMPFHMAQAHSKAEAHPKLGQPTEKAASCMASALISSTHYRFSGHPSDGNVYVEESGTVDAATGDNIEMIVRTGQISSEKVDLAVSKITLSHSDFGTGEMATIVGTFYRDTANTQSSRSQSIRLDGNRGTTIGMGRAAELVDFQITYSGTGTGGIGSIDMELEGQGRSGSAQRWVSVSATP